MHVHDENCKHDPEVLTEADWKARQSKEVVSTEGFTHRVIDTRPYFTIGRGMRMKVIHYTLPKEPKTLEEIAAALATDKITRARKTRRPTNWRKLSKRERGEK